MHGSDPRSVLRQRPEGGDQRSRPERAYVPSAQFWELAALKPTERSQGGSSWNIRARNGVVRIVQTTGYVDERRRDHPDEYMVVLGTAESRASITTRYGNAEVDGRAVVIVPPGESAISISPGSLLVEMFSPLATDIVASASNGVCYDAPDPMVPAYQPWPGATAGPRLRVYPVDDVPPAANRFGRIFRSSMGMVNFLYPESGPRDDTRLSPHSHDDFEQVSVQLAGNYVHHIRTPWTVRLADWRPDEHRMLASPAVTIIPAGAIHTSQGVNDGWHQLLDLFCPPRADWASQPGWVLNEDEYPCPAGLG